MRCDVDEVLSVVQQTSPGRHVRRKPETKEGERGLSEDRTADADRRGDEDGRQRVGEDVPPDDREVRVADRACGLDELLLLEREELRAYKACDGHPLQQADDRHDHDEDPDLGAEGRAQHVAEEIDDDEQERKDRQRQEEIGEPHEGVVELVEVARQGPDERPERDRDEHRGEADRDRHATAPQGAREDVAPEIVGSERVIGRWPLERDRVIKCVDADGPEVRPDQGRDDQEGEHRQPGHGEPVTPELVPGVGPQGPRRPQHVGLDRGRREASLRCRH